MYGIGDEVPVTILHIDTEARRIALAFGYRTHCRKMGLHPSSKDGLARLSLTHMNVILKLGAFALSITVHSASSVEWTFCLNMGNMLVVSFMSTIYGPSRKSAKSINLTPCATFGQSVPTAMP